MKAFLLKRVADGTLLPFWNIDANVGARSSNGPVDVQLVQFGFFCMALPSAKHKDVQLKPIFANVRTGVPCTGKEDDPLVIAIRALEKSRGGPQDGFVSKLNTDTGIYTEAQKAHQHLLIILLLNIFDTVSDNWPRLDKHPQCPQALKAHIVSVCKI